MIDKLPNTETIVFNLLLLRACNSKKITMPDQFEQNYRQTNQTAEKCCSVEPL